jgi:hypothetical protein
VTVKDVQPEPLGPMCPRCRRPLRETLRVETLEALNDELGAGVRVQVAFCGACGTTLSAVPPPPEPEPPRVPDPIDPKSLEGRFQLRCRELITEIQSVGFMPGGWIGLITERGAVGAAQELLSTGRILPVTRWLLQRDRADLTMEREMTRQEWAGLFDDNERTEAERRLEQAGKDR